MTLHEILKLALLLTVASHSLGLTNNMLRTTRVLGRAVQRSRRHNDLILQRRRPTQLWGERKSFLSTSAPKEAGGVLNFDDVAAPVFKAAPLTSPKFAANGVFAAKAVDVATINGVRPKASNKVSDDERHDDESTESHLPASSEASYPQPPAVSVGSARLALDAYIIDSAVVDTKSVENYPSIEAYLQDTGIRSQPVDGGNWKVPAPLQWTENFGRRSPEYETILRDIIQLQPGDEDYFDVSNLQIPDVAFVRTKEQAAIVLEKLMAADPAIFHACDTEVMDIDLKSVGPVGNGYCTCVSIYSGPDFDYGLGQGPGATLWIDNLDDACGILQEFKEWFENERLLKVWHNYGFDRHIMWNEGIDVRGFGGDTMHMARLQDSSRAKNEGVSGNGYSLEALTSDLLGERKQPMKEIFGIKRQRKDGTEGILVDMPPVEVMQRDPRHRAKWVTYSCYDARGTWRIRNKLADLLKNMPWIQDTNLYDYYWMHMRPFGEVLTDMERRGIRVNANDYLAKVELQAREDRSHHVKVFRQWAAKRIGADGLALNTASSVQLCTFLFGGAKNEKTKEITEQVRVFKVPRDEIPEDALEAYRVHDQTTAQSETLINGSQSADVLEILDSMKALHLKALCKERGLKVSGKKSDFIERLREHFTSAATKGNFDAQQSSPSQRLQAAEVLEMFDSMTGAELKTVCRERGLKLSGKKSELLDRLLEYSNSGDGHLDSQPTRDDLDSMSVADLGHALIARGITDFGTREELLERLRQDIKMTKELHEAAPPTGRVEYNDLSRVMEEASKQGVVIAEHLAEMKVKSTVVPKFVDVTITSLGLKPEKYTDGGSPSVTADVLRKLAGDPFADPPKYGTAFKQAGKEGCEALYSLCSIGSIDTMIANFLTSLQELADDQSRVHCSLNLNTETGRLSSRRPNLQNQPALEKDKYKIRKAFESSPGNNLIVADYGQLELRILASITECKSMIDAFEAGGDFHSRTAMDMFPYIKEKLDSNECLLEWDYSKGSPPMPLLKDMYASERRKAKTLNFSIAYGKTAHGLSQDWGVSTEEAEKMLQAWYSARPEVLKWQEETKEFAKETGITRTIMGRYRQLPFGKDAVAKKLFGRSQRASINTPIQGGAADIAMMAMNKINQSRKLQRLGWILLLQIHDEVILEGPEETAEEAFEDVLTCMQEPWVFGLKKTAVPLLVDGSYTHKTWYDAK